MTTPKNTPRVLNSDPLGRKHDNVPMSYFKPERPKGRGGSVSLSGLRPSFFAMLKRTAEKSPKGE